MNAKQKISNRITSIYGDNSPVVWKGWNPIRARYGWNYTPFNSTPIDLGRSLAEALTTLDDIESDRDL